ncbi:uncharacterized protein [Oscarella lobularis]|uniref:uncharacterized protein isoform X7 n=1 Tax=Oscarella lobularis TaxID=121494 RepID=UPI0033133D01
MTETGSKRGDRDERRGRCTIAKVLLLNLSRFIKFTVGAVYFRGSVRAESILIGMGGTRTRARDAREKEEQAIKKMKEYQGIDDVEECKEEGYEQGTRVGRTEK